MKCTECDYALWNLTSRNCPECNHPFRPGEFRFVPNTVQFCCPHCQQPFYGTDMDGLLQPRSFECVKCDEHITMDDMVLRPAPGVSEEQTRPKRNYWLEPDRTKSWPRMHALWQTIVMAMVRPGELSNATPHTSRLGPAVGFASLLILITTFGQLSPMIIIFVLSFVGAGGGGMGGAGGALGGVLMGCGVCVGVALLIEGGFLLLWALCTHLLLAMSGKVDGGLRHTAMLLCFSSGANALSIIPCVGQYPGFGWWAVSAILLIYAKPEVSGVRATCCVLAFPAIAFVGGFALYFGLIYTLMATPMQMQGPMMTGQQWGTAYIAPVQDAREQMMLYVDELDRIAVSDGAPPRHGAALFLDTPFELMMRDRYQNSASTTILAPLEGTQGFQFGERTLEHFLDMLPPERADIIDAELATWPDDVVAHSVGEFVFIYGEANWDSMPATTWVALWIGRASMQEPIVVGLRNGGTLTIPREEFSEAVERQNNLRRENNMPLLPGPSRMGQSLWTLRDSEQLP